MTTCYRALGALLTALFLSTATHAVDPTDTTGKAKDLQPIINGSLGDIADYPWLAFLAYDSGQQYCGASLISST